MKINRKKSKIFIRTIAILAQISVLLGQVNIAGAIKIPSVEEILDKVEKRYGYDPNILRRSKRQESAPYVELYFNNTSPKEGEKITASTVSYFFKNSTEDLYYTWYLVRAEDDLRDGDALEKAKRRAMGIVARGDFNPELFAIDYEPPSGENDAYDPDDDGYKAPMGGADGKGGKESWRYSAHSDIQWESDAYLEPKAKQVVDSDDISRCYRHNFGTKDGDALSYAGEDLVVECEHKFAKPEKGEKFTIKYEEGYEKTFKCQDSYKVGDGKFGINEEACWRLDPNNPDTDGDGVEDEADLAGLGQSQFTWTYKEGDKVGVAVEGTSMIPITEIDSGINQLGSETASGNEVNFEFSISDGSGSGSLTDSGWGVDEFSPSSSSLTPYYKIMWAMPDTCSSEAKELRIQGDECDGKPETNRNDEDYRGGVNDEGFPYLALIEVNEKGGQNLDTTLVVTPDNPIFDGEESLFSDEITIKSSLASSEPADTNFIYYDWDIYKCAGEDFERCVEDGQFLTLGCRDGDSLERCTGASYFKSNSYVQGMGLKELSFQPKEKLFEEGSSVVLADKVYLKVFLKTKRYKNDKQYAISEAIVSVTRKDNKIIFRKMEKDEKGSFRPGEEICKSTDGIYSRICPVYPGQMVLAVAEIPENTVSYSWQYNGEAVNPPAECIYHFVEQANEARDYCKQSGAAIIPITGEEMSVGSISFRSKGDAVKEVTSERMISINRPVAIIKSNDLSTAKNWIKEGGSESKDVFQAKQGETVKFKAEAIPDYLKIGKDVRLSWSINGQEINQEFINSYPNWKIEFPEPDQIEFRMIDSVAQSIELSAQIEKFFSFEEGLVLGQSWNILDTETLISSKAVTIKTVDSFSDEESEEETASIKLFLASAAKNTPEYLFLVLKLSIILVLFWGALFGHSFIADLSNIKRK